MITKITKFDMIESVSDSVSTPYNEVRHIYETIEKVLLENIRMANELSDVSIRVFDGITVKATYHPEKEKLNNLTHKKIIVPENRKAKVKFSKTFCEKINS